MFRCFDFDGNTFLASSSPEICFLFSLFGVFWNSLTFSQKCTWVNLANCSFLQVVIFLTKQNWLLLPPIEQNLVMAFKGHYQKNPESKIWQKGSKFKDLWFEPLIVPLDDLGIWKQNSKIFSSDMALFASLWQTFFQISLEVQGFE